MTLGRFIQYTAAACLIVAGMAPSASAQSLPVVTGVSGTLQDGANLTVTGTGFGTKATAAPMKWDDFEGGTNGSTVSNGWNITTGCNPSPCHPPIYSTGVVRGGSAKSARANFDDGGRTDCPDPEGCNWSSSFGIQNRAMPKIYVDAWVYYAPADPEPRNVKLIRVHTNSYQPNLYLNIYCSEDTDGIRLGQDGGGSSIVLPKTPWRGESFFYRNWRHIQMYLEESSPGVADGSAVVTIDNVTSLNRIGTFLTRTSSTQYWNTVWIGNYAGHNAAYACAASPGNTYIYWDDAYIDNTRAHVEIGDAATYATCTHTEVQIPSAWTSNSITVKTNQGSFASLSNLYLYVMDENGLVNATGYRLGTAGTDLVAPASVNDLRPKSGS